MVSAKDLRVLDFSADNCIRREALYYVGIVATKHKDLYLEDL
jgi:hypothetical protein